MKLEGKNAIVEALNANSKINKVFILKTLKDDFTNKIIKQLSQKNIPFYLVEKEVLEKESKTAHHQGFIGFMDDYRYASIDDMLTKAKALEEDLFLVILDGIEDPHNLGSIIRSAECAGVHGVIIPKNNACSVNETVIRTSAGSVNHMLVAQVTNINQTIRDLKQQNVFCYALEANGNLIYDTNLTGDIALIVGSEGYGVSKRTKELSDQVVSLPMFGKVNSLNASVASAIGIYEALKQRKF
jgi:23S rRNA (guanosine2251-2'-O)-methyltransferase